MSFLFAKRVNRLRPSAIREAFKMAAKPDIISLAGGLPAPESFPLKLILELQKVAQQKYGPSMFQYAATDGFPPLQKALVKYLSTFNIQTKVEEVGITTGAQQGLDLFGKIFIQNTVVAVESPTYLGALQAFELYSPKYVSLKTDEDGVIPNSLEKVLQKVIKLVYLIPNFQNPSGRTLSAKRRGEVAKLLRKYDALLLEDNPYGELRYTGKPLPSLKSLAPENVIYLGTFSKILSPGMRLGYFVAPAAIAEKLIQAKQGVDLHTSVFDQAIATEYLEGGHLKAHLPKILAIYKPRLQTMLTALENNFDKNKFTWSHPSGGMFLWLEGPKNVNLLEAYPKAIAAKVAYIAGTHFFAQRGKGLNTARLNFTNQSEANIAEGIKRLASIFK
jgi:2-aminoadipate transaminase